MNIFLERHDNNYVLHVGQRWFEIEKPSDVQTVIKNRKYILDNGAYISLASMTNNEDEKMRAEFPEVFV